MPETAMRVQVRHVIDGDTVILANGRRLRAIGINAPEMPSEYHKGETGAFTARRRLTRLIGGRNMMWVVSGKDRHDKYGRWLTHWFSAGGRSIQAQLLREGLAKPLTIAPNLAMLDCYRMHGAAARRARRGLWKRERRFPVSSSVRRRIRRSQ